MRRLIVTCAVAASASLLSGCYAVFGNNANNSGTFQSVDFSKPMKVGKSCATNVLYLFDTGSALIADAAKSAGIRKVQLVENKTSGSIFHTRRCVIVTGE